MPLDLHAVAAGGSTAFALATPMRICDLLALAVREVIGPRAPADKFSRSMRRTLDGLDSGAYTLDINGRTFTDAKAVVVCEGAVDVRFFLNRPTRTGLEFLP